MCRVNKLVNKMTCQRAVFVGVIQDWGWVVGVHVRYRNQCNRIPSVAENAEEMWWEGTRHASVQHERILGVDRS